MGFFTRNYEPGSEHHVRITDDSFLKAQSMIRSDDGLKQHYKAVATEYGCAQYEAHDFPVSEIIGSFLLSYALQEEANGVPNELRIENIQLGRKDQVEYQKFVERFNEKVHAKGQAEMDRNSREGVGGMLFGMVAGAAMKGIAKVATGKSEDVRWFEKGFTGYLCGDSEQAKTYLVGFATEFGGVDKGVTSVAKAIRDQFWISEFAKYNRSK